MTFSLHQGGVVMSSQVKHTHSHQDKKWKKYNEIQFTKNKMDLNIRKMINHPPPPRLIQN